MTPLLKLVRLAGEMLSDCEAHLDDSVSADYRSRLDAIVGEAESGQDNSSRLWATIAALSGVAGMAVGATEVSCDSGDPVSDDTVNRLRQKYDAATNFAGVVPLTAGGGK